jgi:hypothetical protein
VKRLWIALAVLGIVPGVMIRPARAADIFEKVGTFDGQFLKIGIGARAAGMGGAFVAVADDPSAVFWNPAGLARLEEDKTSVMVNHIEWPASVNIDQATLVFHVKGLPGAVAVNARSLSVADEPVRDSFRPDGTGEFFDAGYTSFGATYARSFTDKFSAGASINLVRLGLAEFSQETITFDLGTLYDVGVAGMKIGFAIQNIGGQVQFIDRQARVPTVFRVGTSAEFIKTGSNRLIGSFEFSHPPDNSERLNGGMEYGFKDFLFLRGGYNFNYDSEGIAAGAGVKFPVAPLKTNATFDYAYTDMKTLGAGHRISLNIRF